MEGASWVRSGRMLGAAVVAGFVAASVSIGHAQQAKPQPPVAPASNVKDDDRVLTAEEAAEKRLERQRAALERALFASEEPLPITLIADFKAVNRDRNPESTKVFPATLVVANRNGGEDRITVNIRTRGHSRRMSTTCTFAPIRIEFPEKTAGTVFEGHKSLKLGTHCRDVDSYEQYVYKEYLVYKIFNRITARSFRARLASATYVDASTNKPLESRAGLFIEDDDDVARRLGGLTTELQGMTFSHVDPESMTLVGLFEYMIGNTDMSLLKLHNIILVRASNGVVYPVPYDFDYSGLVNARYAVPAKALELATVRERLYRGPCLTQEDLAPFLTRLGGMREGIMSLYDSIPALDNGYRKDAKGYLDGFFKIIEKPGDAKRAFIDGMQSESDVTANDLTQRFDSRRMAMRRTVVLGALIAVGALSVGLAGQQQRAALPDLQKVKDNFYIIGSSSPVDRSQFTGGNVSVFVTDAGVTVVDSKLAGYGPDIIARIKAVTNKPITTLINTHTHGDHTGSNEGFPTSVNIVAHENTKALMAKMDAFKGDKAQFLPKQTYKDKLTLGSGKDRVELYYFGKGHTGGDTMVYFPTLRILATGDLWAWKDAPLLDLGNDGSGVELPRTLAKALATIKDFDTVIPGHTPVSKPAELQEYQRYMADLVAETEAAIKAGKSSADAAAASTVTAKYPGYKSERLKAAVEAIYKEMGK